MTCDGCRALKAERDELEKRLELCHSDITKRRILQAGTQIIKRYEGRPDIQRELASMVMTLSDVPPGDASEADCVMAGTEGAEC